MREQKLMVTGLYRPGWHRWPDLGQVPYLPLLGQWLVEAGFPAGARVVVQVVENGELVVRRVEEGEVREAGRSVEAPATEAEEDDQQLALLEREAAHA